jgi:hypothetical protein
MIRFACIKCQFLLVFSEEKAGASQTCIHCSTVLIVPLWSDEFLDELRIIHDLEVEKDLDDLVTQLALTFKTRRAMIEDSRSRFVAQLSAVYDLEGYKDPEEYLPLLAPRLRDWRTHSIEQMRQYLSELPDDDPLRCPISLFGTLGLGRVETAHTTALAWLLNPSQPHGFGSRLLDALLSYLLKSACTTTAQAVLAEHRLMLSGKSLGRLDIYCEGNWLTDSGNSGNWVLAIEAKIDAGESDKQLDKYDEWIKANCGNRDSIRVFLTPEGRLPESEVPGWIPMSYLTLVCVFREQYPHLRDKPGFHFLRFFVTGILKDICRWKVPVAVPEMCDDPYGVVSYLKTVHHSIRGESHHDSVG